MSRKSFCKVNFANFAKLGAKSFAFREILKAQKISNTSSEAHIMKRTAYTKRNKTDSLEAQFHFSSFVTRESHLFMLYL